MPGPGRRFERGQSGNPSGRPKSDQTVAEMARAHGPEAIATLVEIMRDRKATPSARAMAAERVLDRGLGRPPQAIGLVQGQNRSLDELTDAELMEIVLGAQSTPPASAEPEAEQPPLDPKKVN